MSISTLDRKRLRRGEGCDNLLDNFHDNAHGDVLNAIANAELDGRTISAEEAEAMVLLTIGGGADPLRP